MARPTHDFETGNDGVRPDHEATPGRARWQKVIGIIGLVVVLLIVIGFFIGGGHGPSLHS